MKEALPTCDEADTARMTVPTNDSLRDVLLFFVLCRVSGGAAGAAAEAPVEDVDDDDSSSSNNNTRHDGQS